VAILQVKSLPDDLYTALQERARAEGSTISDFVTRMLRRELAKPSLAEWLQEGFGRPLMEHDVDIEALMDDVRGPSQ
jgi:post-segregation antitoxin (ccd killing protein)